MRGGIPKYRLHRSSGLAVVTLGGKDHYLGKHGTACSRSEYLSRIAEWEAGEHSGTKPTDPTIRDLCERYALHAERHYVKRGRHTPTYLKSVRVCNLAVELYGNLAASRFGVTQFKAVRHQWVAGIGGKPGLCRKTVNQYAEQLREAFRWGVEEGLVPVTVYQSIKAVKSLPKGRSEAHDTDPVRPAPDEAIEAVKAIVHRRVRVKIELQILTGMRPGEVCIMRTCDLDRSKPVWIYMPYEHKTEHKGKTRTIPLGPKAQALVAEFLDDADPERLMFARPIASRKFRNGLASPVGLATSYRLSIAEACEKAECEPWRPSQLRHNAATAIRKRFGIEAAQLALGHSSANTTEIYAEKNLDAVSRMAAEVG